MQSSEGRRVLVIEDDSSVAAGMARGLRRAGFEVELATDGESGAEKAVHRPPALVILDLMLPVRDGFDVLRLVTARCRAPIIVVTARLDLHDRLKAFQLGAADYLTKPFFLEELIARIHARLGLTGDRSRIAEAEGLTIDLDRHEVQVDGEPVHLTPTEFAILGYLAERSGRAISRSDLATALEDLDEADPRNIDAHVSRLRRKLGSAAGLLVTVWGHGYRFEVRRPQGAGTTG